MTAQSNRMEKVLESLLKESFKNAISATGIAIAIALFVAAVSAFFPHLLPDTLLLYGILSVLTVVVWLFYFLTRYRIRTAQFGSNPQEAKEIIEEAGRIQRQ